MNNVFLIGAMKCGTNTLYHNLKRHPHIAIPETKELDYFLKVQSKPYASYFSISGQTKLTLDGTTQYSKYPAIRNIPELIFSMNRNAKIIYLMRDPVARIESNIAHHIARSETITLDNWRESDKLNKAIHFSRYYSQISQYAIRFGLENVFLGVFEDMVSNPESFMKRVCQFLSLDSSLIATKDEIRNPRRSANGADKLKFSEEDDRFCAKEISADIDCLEHVFGVDVRKYWPRYVKALNHG